MRIHVLCSDSEHPVRPMLRRWVESLAAHDAAEITSRADAVGGDILFLVSVSEILGQDARRRYGACIVLHASPVPKGRGWSPAVWQVLEGQREITVSALTAEDRVDTGDIWAQRTFPVEPYEISTEINAKLFACELALMDHIVANFPTIRPRPQPAEAPTYYRRRTPEDSRIDPNRSLAEQFDLLRVCDPVRYPAFFELRGHRYRLTLDRLS